MEKFLYSAFFILLLSTSIDAVNMKDFFENFECGVSESFGTNITNANTTCHVRNITSESQFNEIFKNVSNDNFEYFSGNNFWCSESERKAYNRCQKMRNSFNIYEALIFENSKFEKFPSEELKTLENVKNLTAKSVGLSELNRNDLKSFKSLEILDLTNNNIKYLESLLLLYLPFLKVLFLRYNKIQTIDSFAFDESSKNLISVDLSFNNLKVIDENILNTVGKSNETYFNLMFNQIEKIIPNANSKGKKMFNFLVLNNNRLKYFDYDCSSVDSLYLTNNELEDFKTNNCKLQSIYLDSNNLKNIKIDSVTNLNIIRNPNLTNLTLNVQNLKMLWIGNSPNLKWSQRNLYYAQNLKNLYIDGDFLGEPKIGTFSSMTSLKFLYLKNSALKHIEHGMFSYQKNIETLDISNNNLGSIDINMLSSMKKLKSIKISGNKLTKLDDVRNIKKLFPELEKIDLNYNNWNCSYLVKLIQKLDEKGINVEPFFFDVVKSAPNVMGIACIPENKTEIIQPISLNVNEMNATFSKKLNETITLINDLQVSKQSFAFDFDVIRNETFNLQKSLLEMESTFNNSLLMQKDKINELQLKLKDMKKNVKNQAPINFKIVEAFLIIILTALFIISAFFGYSNFKNIAKRKELAIIRARELNTLDEIVEVNEFQNQLQFNPLVN
ncbi:hypothetical protein PVAND_000990 [Polypedilum vanderplanki]|uniref:Uncharacterized protein n=1 Tax=Polypedilum vanderplanki TaxID=319348 RepID=A0A9J6BLX2_POLVA|nr:hypothetical protein PVAND_000990 [Polypedilum vanderplanki]